MILTHPGLTKLTFMDYLLTMLRNLLRRKLSYDTALTARDRRPLALAMSQTLPHSGRLFPTLRCEEALLHALGCPCLHALLLFFHSPHV